jgi:hypothetical protein
MLKEVYQTPIWRILGQFDVYGTHHIYTPSTLKVVMKKNFTLITSLRNPLDRMASGYDWRNFDDKKTLERDILATKNK